MQDQFGYDPKRQTVHCGLALTGPGTGTCKDPKCRKPAPVLFAGYCGDCAPAHGINLLKLAPEPRKDSGGAASGR